MTISLNDRVENNMGKGEYACYQHFLLFHGVFRSLHRLALYNAISTFNFSGKEGF